MAGTATKEQGRHGFAAGGLIACAVGLLALPSAVLAISTRFDPAPLAQTPRDAVVSPEDAERLARPVAFRSLAKGRLFLFTPANTPNRPDRSITVAVRVDEAAAKAISVRGRRLPVVAGVDPVAPTIAPTAFNLGVARGYRNFSGDLVPRSRKSGAEVVDLGRFSLKPGVREDESRFAPRIVIDETQAGGRAPRTFAGDSDDMVDVGGSYRVTRNLDVTAGVRYSQERERLLPLTDGQQDSQAVYVGTQFRF